MNASSVNPLILWPTTIIIILTAIYQMYLYYKSPNKSKNAVYSIDDDDSLWIFGCIYNNPDDPSLFVNKRFGAGWTVMKAMLKEKYSLYYHLPVLFSLFYYKKSLI